MATLTEARDGLKARLETIPELRVWDHIPGDIYPPAALVLPPVIPDYREDLGEGSYRARFPVVLAVTAAMARQQLDLYEFLEITGPRSVFAAIEADRTLGGLDVDAHAVSVEDADLSELALTNYFTRVVNVDVFIAGG